MQPSLSRHAVRAFTNPFTVWALLTIVYSTLRVTMGEDASRFVWLLGMFVPVGPVNIVLLLFIPVFGLLAAVVLFGALWATHRWLGKKDFFSPWKRLLFILMVLLLLTALFDLVIAQEWISLISLLDGEAAGIGGLSVGG